MARKNKDPAFLMYSADFLVGTALMTHEQVGMYIRILMHQHQSGRLSRDEIVLICGTYDVKVMSKFTQDENGLYYNERLEEESEKRKKYTESRRNNRISAKNVETSTDDKKTEATYDTTYVQSYEVAVSTHMENENVSVNRDDITPLKEKRKNKAKGLPNPPESYAEVLAYATGRGRADLAKKFWDFFTAADDESKRWYDSKGEPIRNWKQKFITWEGFHPTSGGGNRKDNKEELYERIVRGDFDE